MISKLQLAQQVIRILSGGSPSRDSEFSEGHIMLAVSQAFAYSVKVNLFQNKAEGENDVSGGFIYSFTGDDGNGVPIKYNENRKLFYAEIPSSYLVLPNEIGISMVSFIQSQDTPFICCPPNFLSITKGREISNLQGNKGFWVENDRNIGGVIYFVNLKKSEIQEGKGVIIKLVCGLEDIDEDTPINIPPDIQAEIINKVVAQYSIQNQIPKDVVNNNQRIQNPTK